MAGRLSCSKACGIFLDKICGIFLDKACGIFLDLSRHITYVFCLCRLILYH